MKEIKIGRAPDNDIQLSDPSVSRHHASLIISGSICSLRDHGSANGTYINGVRVNGMVELKSNDIVKLGNALIPWRNYVGDSVSEKTHISGAQNITGSNSNPLNQRSVPNYSGSLVCGILGVLFSIWGVFGIIGLVLSIIAISLGLGGTKKYQNNPELYTSATYNMANAGKILGIIGLSLFTLMLLIVLIAIATGEIR